MAYNINLFNYENQKLSADELRHMNSFNSYNFAGIVGKESPFNIPSEGYLVDIKDEAYPVIIMGGGLLFTITEKWETIRLSSRQKLAYIKVVLDEAYGSITTSNYEGVSLEISNCSYVSFDNAYTIYSVVTELEDDADPSILHYYEYIVEGDGGKYILSSDTEIDTSKVYYNKYEYSGFTFKLEGLGTATYRYNGNTIWVNDNTFIIPLLLRDNDTIKEVFTLKDLKDVEGFMSLEAYSKLKAYCEGTFVWSIGGEEEVVAPDGTKHKKGDIGNLNISGDTIKNTKNENSPVKITNLNITSLSDGTSNDRLFIDNGNLSIEKDYIIPIEHGGTNAMNKQNAKINLGITYGETLPDPHTAQEGDIFLKIIE